MLKCLPTVFAVEENYQIAVLCSSNSMVWVKIGEEIYCDEVGGLMRSLNKSHLITVPMNVLDSAGEYTVFEQEVTDRRSNFPKTNDVTEQTFSFKPVPRNKNIRAYHISDAHSRIEAPVNAAECFGKIDFLILNGDIPDNSCTKENIENVFLLAGEISKGEIPVVFSRGNHDMRGTYAEYFCDIMPSNNGKSYYTVKLGGIWMLILDCGEDKLDSHAEYNNTIRCHAFRKRETEFIKQIAESDAYNAPDVTHKLVISHIPFTRQSANEEFAIEKDTYSMWGSMLKENIKPDLMICGHCHINRIYPVGGEFDSLNQPCTLVMASEVKGDYFAGCGFEFNNECIKVSFTDNTGKIDECSCIPKNK